MDDFGNFSFRHSNGLHAPITKSGKLEYAFKLMDDDRDGKLTRQGLWRFLRSFLTVLICLSSSDNIMIDEKILSSVDNGAS
jgi:Ca2+-binding EF-hand superfamily protein